MADIFLSYSSKDKERVRPLVHAFEREGWTVWWDRKIPASETFDQMIERELSASRCVVVVWSLDSVKSRWVREEAEDGRARNLLFPVRIDRVTIPLGFRLIQSVDLEGWTGYSTNQEFQHLVHSIKEKIGNRANRNKSPQQWEPTPQKPHKPQSGGHNLTPDEPSVSTGPSSRADIQNDTASKVDPNRPTPINSSTSKLSVNKLLPIALVVVLVGGIIFSVTHDSDKTTGNPTPPKTSPVQVGSDSGTQVKESTRTLSLSNGTTLSLQMVDLPGGEFQMGDTEHDWEKPVHWVKVAPFSIGKYEVTQAQWQAVMGKKPSSSRGDKSRPVEPISWNDAQQFLKKIGNGYRLPTEAEWEYAARGGTTTKYSFGDDESKIGEYAWYYKNSGWETHPVGQKKPNPFGLHDIHGNVWEWVEDNWHDSYKGAPTDGSAWIIGDDKTFINVRNNSVPRNTLRVLRGGSIGDDWNGDDYRSANRIIDLQDDPVGPYGFRVAVGAQTQRQK